MIHEALSGSLYSRAFESRPGFPTVSSDPQFISSRAEVIADILNSTPAEVIEHVENFFSDGKKALWEHFKLHFDPVLFGYGVPRGNGESVFYMGGLFSMRFHYADPVFALRNAGWEAKTVPWSWMNIKPPVETAKELMPLLREEAEKTGKKSKVIGHSLGGYDWAATFAQNPHEFVEYVDHIVFDASPRPTRFNKILAVAYLLTRIPFREDDFELSDKVEFLKEAEDAGYIKVTSIDSSNDPMIQGEPLGKEEDHFIVDDASHSFLGGNTNSLRIIAHRLANQEPDLVRSPAVRNALAA